MGNQNSEKLHSLPKDLKTTLGLNKKFKTSWESLTPLARNEWICWITSVKKPETRENHLNRAIKEIPAGKRRPCCFAGCPHR
jgi:uncharacterized protein YdeI (YjbR/CyaY-like superfamily)